MCVTPHRRAVEARQTTATMADRWPPVVGVSPAAARPGRMRCTRGTVARTVRVLGLRAPDVGLRRPRRPLALPRRARPTQLPILRLDSRQTSRCTPSLRGSERRPGMNGTSAIGGRVCDGWLPAPDSYDPFGDAAATTRSSGNAGTEIGRAAGSGGSNLPAAAVAWFRPSGTSTRAPVRYIHCDVWVKPSPAQLGMPNSSGAAVAEPWQQGPIGPGEDWLMRRS